MASGKRTRLPADTTSVDQTEAAAICAAELAGQRNRSDFSRDSNRPAPRRVPVPPAHLSEPDAPAPSLAGVVERAVEDVELERGDVHEHDHDVQPLRGPRPRQSSHPLAQAGSGDMGFDAVVWTAAQSTGGVSGREI